MPETWFRNGMVAAVAAISATLASPSLALNVDGLLEAGEYANSFNVQMPGQTGLSELYFTDSGVDVVNFYFKFSIDAVDNTYGANADPAYSNHTFKHLVGSDNLTLNFGVGSVTLDYLSKLADKSEFQSCGALNNTGCENSNLWDDTDPDVKQANGSTVDIPTSAVIVETSLDYNLNDADGFVRNASANSFTEQQRFDAVTNSSGGNNSGSSPIVAPAGSSALADPNNLWLTYVGYEFSITRDALQLSGGETFDISMLTSLSTHISPPKSGPETSTCVIANNCATETTPPSPPSDVPAPATIVLLGSALLLGARRMRRSRRQG